MAHLAYLKSDNNINGEKAALFFLPSNIHNSKTNIKLNIRIDCFCFHYDTKIQLIKNLNNISET